MKRTSIKADRWLGLEPDKWPLQEHIRGAHGHGVTAPVPDVRGPGSQGLAFPFSRAGRRGLGGGEEPAPCGCAPSRGSSSRGLSQTCERTKVKTAGVLRDDGIPQSRGHLCSQTRKDRGKILGIQAPPSPRRPTPRLLLRVIHTKGGLAFALGNPRDRR